MLNRILLALFSAALYVLSFPTWNVEFLIWISFLPFLFALDQAQTKKEKTILALTCSFGIGIGGFYWIKHAAQNYGGLPDTAALLLLIIFAFISQAHLIAYVLLRKYFQSMPFKLAILYVSLEWLYPKLFTDTAGHALYSNPILRQNADWGGVYSLTFLILYFQESLYESFRTKKYKKMIPVLSVITLFFAYGSFRVQQWSNDLKFRQQHDPAPARIALIQANIGDFLKIASERGSLTAQDEVISRYLDLSTQAKNQNPEIMAVVWPETAYPNLWGQPQTLNETLAEKKVRDWVQHQETSLITGGYDRDALDLEYNSIFQLDPSGHEQTYHKSILLQFGETLPFAQFFPELKSIFPNMGFFGQGPGPTRHHLKNQKSYAPSICYEGLEPAHALGGTLLGVDAHLNVTNDSWFGPNGEPDLHLALTQFRSIESRTPFIRATNTGYTLYIDELGERHDQSELNTSSTTLVTLYSRSPQHSPLLLLAKLTHPWLSANSFALLCVTALLAQTLVFRKKNRLK